MKRSRSVRRVGSWGCVQVEPEIISAETKVRVEVRKKMFNL